MADSAPGQPRQPQSVAAHHRIAMRRTALFGPLRPAPPVSLLASAFIVAALTTSVAAGITQQYLVCKDIKTDICLTWLEDIESSLLLTRQIYPHMDISHQCGLSDMQVILPHQKFITVTPLKQDPVHIIFCKIAKLIVKDSRDWMTPKTENNLSRTRRQTPYSLRGRYRGQTQSQYLAIDRGNGKDEGKAEAHSAADSSRASVSGSSGMGQAQSQTMYDPSCDDCVGRSGSDAESLKRRPFDSHGGGSATGTPIGGANIPVAFGKPGASGIYGPGQSGSHDGTTIYGPNGNAQPGFGPNQHGGGSSFEPNRGGGSVGGYGPNQGGHGSFVPNQNAGYGNTLPGVPETFGGRQQSSPPGTVAHGGIPSGSGVYPPQSVGAGAYPSPNNIPQGMGPGGNSYGPGQGGGYSPPNQLLMPSVGSGNYGPGQQRLPGGSGSGTYAAGQNGLPGGTGVGSYRPGQNGLSGGTGSGSYGPGQNGLPGGVGSGSYGQGQNGLPGGTGSGSYIPGQNGLPGGSGSGPYAPGQSGIPGGTSSGPYAPGQSGIPGGTGSQYAPSQSGIPGETGSGQYAPGQNGIPGGTGNGQYAPGQSGIPGRTGSGPYAPGQSGIPGGTGSGPYAPGQSGLPGGIGSGPYAPGQSGLPGGTDSGTYGPGQNGLPGGTGSGSYITGQNGVPGGTVNGAYGPNQVNGAGNNLSPGSFTPGQTPSNGAYGGTNWPSTKVFTSPDGTTYYCCVVGPNNNPQYLRLPASGNQAGLPHGTPLQSTGQNLPNGLLSPPGPYGSNKASGSNEPYGIYSTGPSRGIVEQYGPGSRPGTTGGTGSYGLGPSGGQTSVPLPSGHGMLQGPGGGQQVPGSLQGPGGAQGPGGLQGPGGIYGQGALPGPGGLQGQGGLQGPGNIQGQGNIQGPNGLQVPGGIHGQSGLQEPGALMSPGNQLGHGSMQAPGALMSPGSPLGSGSLQVPGNLQGISGIQGPSGLQVPGGQYGSLSPGGLNGLQGTGTQPLQGPLGQFGTGGLQGSNGVTNTGQNSLQRPTGNYGAGPLTGQTGSQGPNTIYGPGSTGGQSALPNQYIPGTAGQNGYGTPAGTYDTNGPGNVGGQHMQHPYGSGGTGGQNIGSGGTSPYGHGSQGDLTGGQTGIPNQYGTGQGSYGPQYGNGITGTGQYGNGLYGLNTNGNSDKNVDYAGTPQNVMDPNSIGGSLDDDSEAEASVSQAANGTIATASSKGGNDKGRAQTHVQGAYTGGGSFTAQAEISGENKAANSEVTGDKKGASSNAQGSGRNNKSQANVQLGSETGSVLTGSQSQGTMHSSNTQVQGSVKGGMADAQARGPGSTSSQAQIGFTPYKEGDKSHDLQKIPFVGGGTAAAQSSGRTGSSQSQLRGTFQYGITYNGGAQAGASLDKDTVFPNRLPFDKIDVYDESNKNINVNIDSTERSTESASENYPYPESSAVTENTILSNQSDVIDIGTNARTSTELPFDVKLSTENTAEIPRGSDMEYGIHTHSDHHKVEISPPVLVTRAPPVESRRSFQSTYSTNTGDYEYTTDKEESPPEDYDVDDGFGPEGADTTDVEQGEYSTYNEFSRDTEQTHQSLHSPRRKGLEVRQTTGGNTQHILLGSLKNHDAEITQRNSERPDESKVYQPGERVPGTGGYTIPVGFTGSVKSVASKDKTYVVGSKDSPSQAQTVSLTPGHGKVKYTYPAGYARNVNPKNLRSLYQPKPDDSNRYVSVSKSVTRDLDAEDNVRKQYSHTYYTKSSSCGYFTFTCTMVSGAEGKKKVCKPKIPTNPDGTPMRC